MENTKLKAFTECVRCGSITGAAESLGYTPSAVSQLITSLERDLGLQLLIRSKRGVKLTSEGETLMPSINRCLASENEIYQLANELKGITTGKLTIAAYPSVATNWLPGIIRRYKNDYPGIKINIMECIRSDIYNHFEHNEADLAIFAYSEPMPYEWIPLADEAVIAVIPEDHPLAEAKSFPIKECENYDFVMGSWGNEAEIIEILDKNDVHPDIKYTTYDTPATLAMVRMGLAMSLVNELSAQYWSEHLVKLPLDPPEKITFGIALPSRSRLSNAAEKFLQYAMEAFASESTEGSD